MSDSAKVWDVDLSEDDVTAFLQERASERPCYNCGHQKFMVGLVAPGGGEYLAILTMRDSGGIGSNHLPIFTAACLSCGLTSVYSTGPLLEWKKEKLAKESGAP